MERKNEMNEMNEEEMVAEWEKPSVKELDINAITLSGFIGSGADNVFYS